MTAPSPLAGLRPARYSPEALRFEAFTLHDARTQLLPPLSAETLKAALAETTQRWSFDRGDRLAVRELGDGTDRLHIYAVRRKSAGLHVWNGYVPSIEHERWLDHVGTVDLNIVAGIAVGAVGSEIVLHERRQAERPEGARMGRER